ncbi:MAG: Eco57I restriction-modification methylase domain-containing protein [Bacteroidales bacterium]|nr:Eco57I restriction-modification methylase domain-containing protein [Bacteroidales bacterium]
MPLSIQTTTYCIIYVYQRKEITDALKIGKASIVAPSTEGLEPNCKELNEAAIECIKKQTQRAAVDFDLLYTELGWYQNKKGQGQSFDDNFVHEVLRNNGYEQKLFDYEIIHPQDWYKVDLETVKKTIAAIKSEDYDLHKDDNNSKEAIDFRKEQTEAIDSTIVHFKKGQKMLWNAKMRFGKTLCALDLIRRQNYKRTLILTHKPAVRSGWFEDYHKIDFQNFLYGSKEGSVTNLCNTWGVTENGKEERIYDTKGKDFATLEKEFSEHDTHFIYFASMQDLRGSKNVSEKGIDKNDEVFNTDWDLIILDEAHDGTETPLGQNVINGLCDKRTPKLLYLSGTPFNILYHFSDDNDEIFTWDYVMEQEAKEKWDEEHPGEKNPYEGLARLNICTYNLGEVFPRNGYIRSEDDYFNFAEFFRVWKGDEKADGAHMPSEDSKGKFVHEDDVTAFLSLLCDPTSDSKYPFTTEEFCNGLNHTLWMLPGVDAAKALADLINSHPLHTSLGFTVINVAGEGSKIEGLDEDDAKKIEKLGNDMLAKVKAVIKEQPRTITLSCGRLTTGVSVPEWTGVFMLRGGADVDAGNYMQTIFRGQTPYKNGAIKSNCYAFDFSPDRTLTVVYDYVKKQPSKRSGKSKGERVASLLRFCPVIAMEGGNEDALDARDLMDRVHEAYKLHYKRHGLKGSKYTKNWNLKGIELFEQIGKLFNKEKVGVTGDGKIDLSQSGLTGEKGGKKGKERKKPPVPPKPKTPKSTDDRKTRAQNVADQILTRLPLLLFGAVTDASHLSFEQLLDDNVIDLESWSIFMPEGFTKPIFAQAAEYLEEEGIIVIADSIIKDAQAADLLPVGQRVREIATMLKVFHFPDHETILTPWRVVNMHMGDTLGGFNFYDETYRNSIAVPRWIEAPDGVTEKVFKEPATQILEINSKSGVYPLYLAYTLWRVKCEERRPATDEAKLALWDEVLANHVFVLCQTLMAQKITERVLRGYREFVVTHCTVYPKLVEIFRAPDNAKNCKKKKRLTKELKKTSYWNINNGKKQMKFSAVVSNPPYQVTQESTSDDPLYHQFMDVAFEISDYSTFITPGRFLFNAGKTPAAWNHKVLNDEHFKVVWYKSVKEPVFDGVVIKGGVAVTVYDKSKDFGKIVTYTTSEQLNEVLHLVIGHEGFESIDSIIYLQNKFDLESLYADRNDYRGIIGSNGKEKRLTTSIFSQLDIFSPSPINKDDICILGLIDNVRHERYIPNKYLEEHVNTDKYKVVLPKSNGKGELGEPLSEIVVLGKQHGFTQSFISFGAYEEVSHAEALRKYLMTKFVRILLGVLKVTQDNSKDVWKHVPLQDFTSASDIDYTQSIENIDQQLYEKYGLQEYIEFIENTVRPME